MWLIWSNEHNAYWRANELGYTPNLYEAGNYTLEKAIAICSKANYRPDIPPNECIVPSPSLLVKLAKEARSYERERRHLTGETPQMKCPQPEEK